MPVREMARLVLSPDYKEKNREGKKRGKEDEKRK